MDVRYEILVLSIVFEVLLCTCKLDRILNSYSFRKYLVMAFQTSVTYFIPPYWFGITKTAPEPRCKGPYQVVLTTQVAVQFLGSEPKVHSSQLERAPPDSWNCRPAGDLTLKLIREVSFQKQMTSWDAQQSQNHGSRSSSPIWKLYSFAFSWLAFSLC